VEYWLTLGGFASRARWPVASQQRRLIGSGNRNGNPTSRLRYSKKPELTRVVSLGDNRQQIHIRAPKRVFSLSSGKLRGGSWGIESGSPQPHTKVTAWPPSTR
jgi:hypothetical protein